VLSYVKQGKDVMSVATFLESSLGVLAGGIGIAGLALSWALQNKALDIGASIIMSSLVTGCSHFLLGRTQSALLGRSLPEHVSVRIIQQMLQNFPCVSDVQDVKTEIVGTDTVRFKAEIKFNPDRVSQLKKPTSFTKDVFRYRENAPSWGISGSSSPKSTPSWSMSRLFDETSSQPEENIQPPSAKEFEELLVSSDAQFYVAMTKELRKIEEGIRRELSTEFQHVHVDLEIFS